MTVPPETQLYSRQIERRAELFEGKAQEAIYVSMPQAAMELQEMLQSNSFLQQEFVLNLQAELSVSMETDNAGNIDMHKVITALERPPQKVYEFEDLIRSKAWEIVRIVEVVKRWVTIADAEEDQLQCLADMAQAIGMIEELCGQLIQRLLSYHTTRIRLVGKLQRRKLYDIAKTVIQHDVGQVSEIIQGVGELYNNLIIQYDAVVRHFERFKKVGRQPKHIAAMY